MLTEPLKLDELLCFALYGANMTMQRAYKPLLDDLGITYPQYLVLNALWEQDGQSIGAIADRLALESSTITPLVKRLEVSGLVTRERNPKDERQVHVRLTDKGKAMHRDSMCLSESLLDGPDVDIAELGDLLQRLQKFRDALAARNTG